MKVEKRVLKKIESKTSIILNKPSGTIEISSPIMSLRERKTYNALLYFAKEQLRKNPNADYFTVNLPVIKKLTGAEDEVKNVSFKKVVDKLMRNVIEYNILKKDRIIEGKFTALPWVQIETNKETGTVEIKYDIPKPVRFAIINAGRDKNVLFGKIDLLIERNMSSKYAMILYEFIKDYEKAELPILTIKELRELFGVQNKYKYIRDLKKYVVNPATKEINENPLLDFVVEYQLYKTGKTYTHIKFNLYPKPKALKIEQKKEAILNEFVNKTKENPELKELLAMLPKDLRKKKRIISLVLGSLKKKGKDYTEAQIKYVIDKYKDQKIKNVEAYLKKAIENDYASFEAINLDELEALTYEDLIGEKIWFKGKQYEIKGIEENKDMPEDMGSGDYYLHLKSVDDGSMLHILCSKKTLDKMLEKLRKIKKKK